VGRTFTVINVGPNAGSNLSRMISVIAINKNGKSSKNNEINCHYRSSTPPLDDLSERRK
jgi:hypothetical protein